MAVIAVLVWNFSNKFQANTKVLSFTEFVMMVNSDQIATVTITGNEIQGKKKDGEDFRSMAPPQYENLGKLLIDKQVVINYRDATASPWAALLYNWAPILLMIGFWGVIRREMASGGHTRA